jgi:uncharacterized protein (TIGR02246 family)
MPATDRSENDPLRLADDLAIRNLTARLAHLADETGPEDLDEYISLFTNDASWGPPGREHKGRTEILQGARERRLNGQQGPGTDTRHIVTTQAIRFEGLDAAVSDAYFVIMAQTKTHPTIRLVGAYHDLLRREDGVWRLASRQITVG